MMKAQKKYNTKVLNNISNSNFEKEDVTQNLALCAHSEISSLIDSVNYRKHHNQNNDVDLNKILYESEIC